MHLFLTGKCFIDPEKSRIKKGVIPAMI